MIKVVSRFAQWLFRIRNRWKFGFFEPPYDGMQNLQRMEFLFDSVKRFGVAKSGNALEIGVFKGCSLVFLAKACLKIGIRRICGVDLFTGTPSWGQMIDTYPEARRRMERYSLEKNVRLIRSNSNEVGWSEEIDVLHVDGDHDLEQVRRDIRKFTPFLIEGGLVIFDDYDRAHPGVQQGVHELLGEGHYEVVARSQETLDFGSICLKRVE